MIPGSNHVVACCRCGALAQYRTLATPSGLGASLWTDGLVTGPLLERMRVLFVCRNCDHVQWLYETIKVRIYETWNVPEQSGPEDIWYRAPMMRVPEEQHYYAVLRAGRWPSHLGELVLRITAWQRHNDAFRQRDVASLVVGVRLRELPEATGECLENMERLAEGLSTKAEIERILCAEVLRQLGRFDFALDVLNMSQPTCHPPLARAVRALCEREETWLGEVGRS